MKYMYMYVYVCTTLSGLPLKNSEKIRESYMYQNITIYVKKISALPIRNMLFLYFSYGILL